MFAFPQAFLTMLLMGAASILLLTGGMARLVDKIGKKRRKEEPGEEERAQRAEAHRSMGWMGLLITLCIIVFTEALFRGMQGLAMGAVLAMPVAGTLSIIVNKFKK